MKPERIALHEMVYLSTNAMISTVRLFDGYETIVMFEDGEPIEMYRTASLEEAKATHNKLVHSWNDKLYEGSTEKLLGALNYGQFVKCIKAC